MQVNGYQHCESQTHTSKTKLIPVVPDASLHWGLTKQKDRYVQETEHYLQHYYL